MAVPLEDAIALASEPVDASAVISMHDDLGVVRIGGATLTFRQDLPLLNWGDGDASAGQFPCSSIRSSTGASTWLFLAGRWGDQSARMEGRQPTASDDRFLRAPGSGLWSLWPLWLGSQH
jgi:hypothetical protein